MAILEDKKATGIYEAKEKKRKTTSLSSSSSSKREMTPSSLICHARLERERESRSLKGRRRKLDAVGSTRWCNSFFWWHQRPLCSSVHSAVRLFDNKIRTRHDHKQQQQPQPQQYISARSTPFVLYSSRRRWEQKDWEIIEIEAAKEVIEKKEKNLFCSQTFKDEIAISLLSFIVVRKKLNKYNLVFLFYFNWEKI